MQPAERQDLSTAEQGRLDGQRLAGAAAFGTAIGSLAGLLGLGGAEFRLPVLMGYVGLPVRVALGTNLAISGVTLLAAAGRRLGTLGAIEPGRWLALLFGLVAGRVVGAAQGARVAATMRESRLRQAVRLFLLGIGALFVYEAFFPFPSLRVPGRLWVSAAGAAVFGLGIGWVSGLFGVAGGELLIPTLVFVFGVPVKPAGTLSAMVSLPTILTALVRHVRLGNLPRHAWPWVASMAAGSLLGVTVGTAALPHISEAWLRLLLGFILLVAGSGRLERARHPLPSR